MAAEYQTALPDEKTLAAEIRRTQEILQEREALPLLSPQKTRAKKAAGKKRTSKAQRGQKRAKRAKGIIEWITGKCPIRPIKGSNGSSRS